MSAIDKRLKSLSDWFDQEGWVVRQGANHLGKPNIEAIMDSGYGSGPIVVDLTALSKHLEDGSAPISAPHDVWAPSQEAMNRESEQK